MTKTYLQLAREIASLQAAADKQLAAEKKEAVARLNDIIAKYDLSAADLRFPGAVSSTKKPSAKAKSAAGPAVMGAKYADGSGNTWGGRGPRPQWLREAIAGGKSLESFTASAASAPARKSAGAVASQTGKGVSKKAGYTVAPKYRHPGTGDTWSGRGSAPRWLKEALRKRGTKLDDFLISKPAVAASLAVPAKAAKSSAVSQSKVAAKSSHKPQAKPAPLKVPATKKASGPKASPKREAAAQQSTLGAASAAGGGKKSATKKSASIPTPAPAMPSKEKVSAKKSAAVTQPVAKKAMKSSPKPARKKAAAKKSSVPAAVPGAGGGVPAAPAPSPSSAVSEAPAPSTVV